MDRLGYAYEQDWNHEALDRGTVYMTVVRLVRAECINYFCCAEFIRELNVVYEGPIFMDFDRLAHDHLLVKSLEE